MLWEQYISAPARDEIEITVFGPGYGESTVIFLPGVGWGVIDCCIFKTINEQIIPPLTYLNYNNVQELAFVALTHPHEDHFLGMDRLLYDYEGKIRRLVVYNGHGVRELLAYQSRLGLKGNPELKRFTNIIKAIETIKERGATKRGLGELTDIVPLTEVEIPGQDSIKIHVQALGPSADSIDQYVDLLREQIPTPGNYLKKLNDRHHNLIASAIWVSAGNIRVILGSDVLRGNNERTGWKGILNNIDCPNLSAHVVKVAHHGSHSSFYNQAWERHSYTGLPFSIITPFSKTAKPLPGKKDLNNISLYSNKIGITSETKIKRPDKIYSKEILRAISRVARKWREIEESYTIGFVRTRISVTGELRELLSCPPAYFYK